METVNSELLAKFEKIHALMQAAGTQGEAEAAAAAFERMLIKYNLEAEEIAKRLGQPVEKYERVWIQVAPAGSPGKVTWRVALVYSIAPYLFCRAYRAGHSGGQMLLLGQSKNIEACQRLFEELTVALERVAETEYLAYVRELNENPFRVLMNEHKLNRLRWKNSFFIGAAEGVRQRMEQEKRDATKADTQVSALVVVKDGELKEAEERLIGKVAHGSMNSNPDYQAYQAGVRAGKATGGGKKAIES